MGSFFRSEEMELYCLLIPRENSYNLVSSLGNKDLFHFIDAEPHTPQFSRLYSKQTKRCDELLNKIDEIGQIMNQFGYDHGLGKGDVTNFLNLLEIKKKSRKQDEQYYIDELEKEIKTVLVDIQKQIAAAHKTRMNMNLLVEQIVCLEKIVPLISGDQQIPSFSSLNEDQSRIGKIVGTINMPDSLRFQKSMFRATKGKCFIYAQPIETAGTKYKIINPDNPNEEIKKGIFLFIYNYSSLLEAKLMRICQSVGANVFKLEGDEENLQLDIQQNAEDYQKSKELLRLTYKHLEQIFSRLQDQTEEITLLEQYRLHMVREKQIYHHINLTKNTGAVLKAYVWLPKSEEENIIQFLQTSQDPRYATAQLHPVSNFDYNHLTKVNKKPTKIEKNSFLDVFQEIINTYGVPRYREINPGFFSIVTFPFLFGVMFGDIGHGILLFTYGCYLMSTFDKKTHNEDQLYKCRYIISMMGFFAIFCGFIYNDFMSIPLDLFGSCYAFQGKSKIKRSDECVYPFGMDPVWLDSQNSLTFFNSFKMKTAIILGVSQMLLGILLKGLNSILQLSTLDFFFEFLPQLLFFICTFGYMALLIILKWLSSFAPSEAPSILTIMLNFILNFGELDPNYDNILGYIDVSHKQQEKLQFYLLIIAAVCVPLMLFPKPILQYFFGSKSSEYQQIQSPQVLEIQDQDEIQSQSQHHTHHDKQHLKQQEQHRSHESFSELFIHQVIESIEFVLGSVSHTASYLRLWALSLAHSQLAGVFFEKTIQSSIESSSILGLLVGYFIFALITFGVLMCMDVMECFLHTLRLHWVEFQSKFYKADGVSFQPLSFKTSLAQHQVYYENN
ncbi:hypothetical protein ABPG72_008194 [Tetrahymena utriculariae]